MRWLSQAGVGVAPPFSGLGTLAGRLRIGTLARQSCFPVTRSKAATKVSSALPPAVVALVIKSLFSQITGELLPAPSTSAFQATWERVLQEVGIASTSKTPF